MESRVIKLIAKHGDDLRQDMLTIQMLTIMDKVSFNWIGPFTFLMVKNTFFSCGRRMD